VTLRKKVRTFILLLNTFSILAIYLVFQKILVSNLNNAEALFFLIFALIVIGLVAIIVATAFLENLILFPIRKLAFDVNKIRTSGDFAARVSISGKNELSILAMGVNKMLESLEETGTKLKEVNSELARKSLELERKSSELERINKFMVGRELKMVELKDEIEKLKAKINAKS